LELPAVTKFPTRNLGVFVVSDVIKEIQALNAYIADFVVPRMKFVFQGVRFTSFTCLSFFTTRPSMSYATAAIPFFASAGF
jgi:hypothetical protein